MAQLADQPLQEVLVQRVVVRDQDAKRTRFHLKRRLRLGTAPADLDHHVVQRPRRHRLGERRLDQPAVGRGGFDGT